MIAPTSKTEKIILGIDPGTNVMGYGLLRIVGNKAELIVMGVIDMRKEKDVYLRLGKIFDRVTGIIDEYLPDELAIEAPFFGNLVGRKEWLLLQQSIMTYLFMNMPH